MGMRHTRFALAFVVLLAPASMADAGQGCTFTVNPLSTTVSGDGGSGQISVKTGAGCSWTASTGTPWLSVSLGGGVGSGSVTWVAARNTLRSQRLGSLTVAGRSIFVSQLQPAGTTTAPGAPRQLTAAVNQSSVTLTWSPPDSGSPPATYVIDAGSGSGSSNLGSVATGSTSTSFSASNVPYGHYFVRVSARNATGTSAASNEVSFFVAPQVCVSAPPSTLQSTVNGSLVTLTWEAPAGVSPSSYVLEVGSAASLTDLGTFSSGPAATFSAHAPPGTYFVRVRAVTACGVTSSSADAAVVVP